MLPSVSTGPSALLNSGRSLRCRLAAICSRSSGQVTVNIMQNRPFFILGEVRAPGQFSYVSGMTVETAVAIGGYTSGQRDTFRITRRLTVPSRRSRPRATPLKPSDTVYVFERFF